MAVEKMSLSIPKELARQARREAKAEGISVSAWVARAIQKQTKLAGMKKLVEEYEAEFGAFTEEETEAMRRLWPK
jgi:post-segregation antitoxin (ccd killing protein)